jgi:hypothetical protein
MNEMTDDQFWSLIEQTLPYSSDQGEQMEALSAALDKVSATDIEAFQRAFQRQQKRSFTWDLWGAAYLLNGGASDDGFEYFQRWLISKGRKIFEAAVANADALAELLPPSSDEIYEFEEFGYAASEAWQQKTGINPWKDPEGRFPYTGGSPGQEPSGTPFEEDEDYLAKRFPKLWARAGG